jgi:hypothetical protein
MTPLPPWAHLLAFAGAALVIAVLAFAMAARCP